MRFPAPIVVAAALAATACGGASEAAQAPREPAPHGPTLEVEDPDYWRDLAARFGLSGGEGVPRSELDSDLISAFEQRVSNQERHRYGGLYIRHEPDFRVVVLLTSGDVSDLDAPEHLRGLVVVRHVERTLAELRAVLERLSELRSVVPFSSNTNIFLNRVELGLIAPTRSELESATRTIGDAAAQSGEPLPDWVTVVGHIVPVDQTAGERPDFLLTRSPVGGFFDMDALPSGTLELDLERGCVRLSGRAVVWPAGTTLTTDPPQILLPGGLKATSGDTVRGGGGHVPGAHAREISNVIDGDVDKALECAREPEVVFFTSRREAMTVFRG